MATYFSYSPPHSYLRCISHREKLQRLKQTIFDEEQQRSIEGDPSLAWRLLDSSSSANIFAPRNPLHGAEDERVARAKARAKLLEHVDTWEVDTVKKAANMQVR